MPRTHSTLDLADHVSCVSNALPKPAGKSALSPEACWNGDWTLLGERRSPRRRRSRRQRYQRMKHCRRQEELQNKAMAALASPSQASRPLKVANEGGSSCGEQTGASQSPSQSERPPTKDEIVSHDGRATDLRASLPADSARDEGVPNPPAASSFCPPFASASPYGPWGHGLLHGPYSADNRYYGPTVYSGYGCHIPSMPATLTTQSAPPAALSSDRLSAMVHSAKASGTEAADVPSHAGLQPLPGPATFAPTVPFFLTM
ncbi:hypothetical protein BDQ94DRAFT_176536 [Aspergillus welwitschiae]|uniref:Uncharacterized protein n=1 Tax=Aspergillus welwitschiae TaxID=1341132 RepID=A0A3F3PH70_9EURO|nr:hypothetical protein BDQ94DRAFT_176536 [Aspergillus welwitschiae]RDH26229.1 hypothetical protein BDQ94DRAFT_176536 [Aspergillus welwitschiae]